MPMLENSIAAAKAHGGRILLPGTVYNFGEAEFPNVREDAPQQPHTRKGAIRVQMESRLRQAAADGVRTLIVRAGDYFGPKAANSWFSMMVKAGRPVTSVTTIGAAGVGHQWGYLPDVAETMVRLIEREDALRTFESVHMAGHWDDDGTRMAAAIKRVVGNPKLRTTSFPWWIVNLTWPFVRLFREVHEMRYLWKTPLRLRNDRLIELLGQEPHTPLDTAIRTALMGQGCLAVDAKETAVVAR
jgi:nucleoside-diphosphate-sugar epimerase